MTVLEMVRRLGLRHFLRVRSMMRITERLRRKGVFLLVCVNGKDGMSAIEAQEERDREELDKFFALSLERDDLLREVTLDAAATYLRPLEIETKLFIEKITSND